MDEIIATFRAGLFRGKHVLVSGASSGIRLAIAQGFAATTLPVDGGYVVSGC